MTSSAPRHMMPGYDRVAVEDNGGIVMRFEMASRGFAMWQVCRGATLDVC